MDPDFIILPGESPLTALWEAFPELRSELDDGDSEAYYIYGVFADYLVLHINDDQLWQRAYRFFDSLAVGGERLQEILVVGLFDVFRDNATLTKRVRNNIGPEALKLFKDMESL